MIGAGESSILRFFASSIRRIRQIRGALADATIEPGKRNEPQWERSGMDGLTDFNTPLNDRRWTLILRNY